MGNNVHNVAIDIDWDLLNLISSLDRFDASWSSIERREGQSLKQLKQIATVKSVGASTRIEGSKMSDEEVDVLLNHLDINKLEDRDSQEVVGYFETLDIITESYNNIEVDENGIKHLHNILMKHNQKDQWHKGNYKLHSNAVQASQPDGSTQIIFRTTEPGFPTENSMRSLIEWYVNDRRTHPLVKAAIFTYDFLSIHPFQDGNGRMSRLISTLLLLKTGYQWIQYVSFEHEIESRKPEYYRVLRSCQSHRPNENIGEWVNFFFDALKNIQINLMEKLKSSGTESQLSPREKSIITIIGSRPGIKSGDIANKLGIPNPTVKRILTELVKRNLIEKDGIGPGTNYTIK